MIYEYVHAQSFSDTIQLKSVNVYPSFFQTKDNCFNAGKKIQPIDSVLKNIFSLNTLSDLLNYQTAVYIKNYAPGSIGSSSIRGGTAQQTAVLWNGININHPMLGQSDFSQINTVLFNNISIEYGASSALWGSGAMNGAIRLNNNFSDKNSSQLNYRYGSFNAHQWYGQTSSSIKKLKYYLKGNRLISLNNYWLNDSIQLKNAAYNMSDIMGGCSYRFNEHHLMNYHFWFHNNLNHIPNNYFFNTYSAVQKNKDIRNMIDYLYSKNNWKVGIKMAYLYDNLIYSDSLARINSQSKVHTLQSEENIYRTFTHRVQIFAGHQWVYNYAITNNYFNHQYISRHSVFAGWEQNIKKIKYNIILRKEWANIATSIPLTSNVGLNFNLNNHITLKSQLSTFYRLPTMNDLFWKNSGNIHLKPENGYSYEGSIILNFKYHLIDFFSECTFFNRITDNWIMWLPGGSGQPVPSNIAQVWSRGTETNNTLTFQLNKMKIKTAVSSAYILSTITKSFIQNDASIGRQLIYTPRYNINGYIQILFKKIFIVFTHQYVGYRFISSDNLQWLNPYQISNISAGYHLNVKKINIELFGGINNVFNTQYMIVSQRPMPMRNYYIQINIKVNNPKKPTL